MTTARPIKLRKLQNTRDLGGMRTEDGRTIVCGRLLRSGKLYKLPKSSVEGLKKLGLTTVVDLRISNEKTSSPDTVIEGVKYVSIPLLATPLPSDNDVFETTQREYSRAKKEGERIKTEFGSLENYMIETYRNLLFHADSQEGFKEFLRLVIEEEGCILWHCASGKDRAGICAMLIEALLGVDEEHILHDYMLSRAPFRWKYALNRSVLVFLPVSLRYKKLLFGLMRTRPLYLRSVIDEMKRKYGGIVEYCKAELGITEDDIALLKQKYLV